MFSVHGTIEGKVQRLSVHPLPPPGTASPITNTLPTVVHVLSLTNLHGHITVTQRPWFTSGLTLGVGTFCGFGQMYEYVHVCIHHCPKNPLCSVYSFPLYLLPAPGNQFCLLQNAIQLESHSSFLDWLLSRSHMHLRLL